MSNTTLVTGANGLTGSAVVRSLLKQGRSVRALVLPGTSEKNLQGLDVDIVYGNILDYDVMCQALDGCEYLHHVAAIFSFARDMDADDAGYREDVSELYSSNLEGTTTVLLAAQRHKLKRIVYTSTMACIGVAPGKQLSDEGWGFSIWNPLNDYMRSKYFAEQVAWKFVKAGLPIVSVNPTFTMGPGDIVPTPVGGIVKDLVEDRAPKIAPAGVNIVDVDDVGEGHVLAERHGKVGERYILGGHNVVFPEFVQRVRELAGKPAPSGQDSVLASFPKDYLWYDTAKAETELGFSQRTLDETITRTIDWFRANHEMFERPLEAAGRIAQ